MKPDESINLGRVQLKNNNDDSLIEWVNILKGLGILSIVIGHVSTGILEKVLFLFNVPLFFFVSGYLFKVHESISKYLRKKTISLLLPYLSFLIIFTLAEIIKILLRNQDEKDLIWAIINAFIGGRALTGWMGVFWFITCLYFVQQIFRILISKYSTQITAFITVIFFGLSFFNSVMVPDLWLPWNINVVLAALPIYFIGYQFRVGLNKYFAYAALLIGTLTIAAIWYDINLTYNMKYSKYGVPVITFICSISFVIILMEVSKILMEYPRIAAPFKKLGIASMAIMYLHQPIQLSLLSITGENVKYVVIIITILCSYTLYLLMKHFAISRAFMLGSVKDYEALKANIIHH